MAVGVNTCAACGYAAAGPVGRCPRCGLRARPPKNWRLRGWLQLVMGLLLAGGMGAITYNLAPSVLRPGVSAGGGGFTGTAEQGLLILGLFGLLIAFGLGSAASGLWQIATGRRNNWIFALMLALFALLMLAAWHTTASLKG